MKQERNLSAKSGLTLYMRLRILWALLLAVASALPGFAAAGCYKYVCSQPAVAAKSCCPETKASPSAKPKSGPEKQCSICVTAPVKQSRSQPFTFTVAVIIDLPSTPRLVIAEEPPQTEVLAPSLGWIAKRPPPNGPNGPRAPPIG
jgi:hypothetical protein